MNFLAHYYTGQPVEDPYHALGLILPDLARQHHKGLRFREAVPYQVPAGAAAPKALQSLHEGIMIHHKADHQFHASPFFAESTSLLHTTLKKYPFRILVKHLPFFAHISLELLIDRMLIKEYPPLLEDFYGHLAGAGYGPVASYFETRGHAMHSSGFWNFLQLFIKHKYLQHYPDNEHLAFALSRVYQRATGLDISEDSAILQLFLDEAEALLEQVYTSTFKVLRWQ
jgi:hypothetical protein